MFPILMKYVLKNKKVCNIVSEEVQHIVICVPVMSFHTSKPQKIIGVFKIDRWLVGLIHLWLVGLKKCGMLELCTKWRYAHDSM